MGKIIKNEIPYGGGSGLPDGGTTNQVLAKRSSANGDAYWKTMDADLSNYYTKAETVTQINNAIGAALLASY